MLEIAKAVSLMLTIVSLYPVLLTAFFEPNTDWHERMIAAGMRLAIAACAAAVGGLIFTWPAKSNPDARVGFFKTLPVQLFLWAVGVIGVLFFAEWYLRCGGATSFHVRRDCF
ncbi:MAG: hypothetical protein ABI142_00700 [Bryocella sp.]